MRGRWYPMHIVLEAERFSEADRFSSAEKFSQADRIGLYGVSMRGSWYRTAVS